MKLTLLRTECGKACTIGELMIDGKHECFTLEDVVRPDGVKIHGETAIPAGQYTVDITRSPRFGVDLPLVVNVKGFVGIRIHPGNTAGDTEGCILVGQGKAGASLTKSRAAFDALFPKLRQAKARGEPITLEVLA